MEVDGRICSDVVVLNRFLYSAMEALVVEAAIAASKSLTCSLFVMGSLCNTVDVFLKAPDAFGGFPISELCAVEKKLGPENKDGGETENGDGEDKDDDGQDDDEEGGGDDDDDGEEEGDEGEEEEGDSGNEPEANGDDGSEDDDEEDDEDEDDDDEEDEDEEEEGDEDEEEIPQPPAKRRK